jgi:hypothetical protein
MVKFGWLTLLGALVAVAFATTVSAVVVSLPDVIR